MAIAGIDPKCYILALFVRDDGVRFLLGDDPYEFKDKQLHFQPNTVANDVVEVQGNDGYLLAGQVRRPGTQSFDGYVCNGTNSKAEVEVKRREFLQFFRRSHFYKVIYVFPNGTAIQRKQGFLVDDPTVQELYQQYPEYHVALNFEDVNYYTYEEDDQGQEIYAKEAIVPLAGGGATGGLIWDEYGVVWEDPWSDLVSVSGSEMQIDNNAGAMAPIQDLELQGDTYQQTYSGKNLFNKSDFTKIFSGYISGGGTIMGVTPAEGLTSGDRWMYIECEPNTTYTISKPLPATLANNRFRVGTTSSIPQNGNVVQDFVNYPSGTTKEVVTITTSADAHYLCVFCYAITNSSYYPEFQSMLDNLQIEQGSTATNYEPFVGGQPSPSPSYPQPVQLVAGEQTVDAWGKNLFNYRKYTTAFLRGNGGAVSVSNPSGNILRVSNKVAQSNNFVGIAINGADSLLGKTVTASADVIAMNGVEVTRLALYWTTNSGLGSQIGSPLSIESTGNYVLTVDVPNSFPSNATGIAVVIYGNGSKTGATYGGNGTYVDWANIQFEFGSSATQYEKYQSYTLDLGAIELCKIGDYQDYIYKGADGWYVHKAVTKVNVSTLPHWYYSNGTNFKTNNDGSGFNDYVYPASNDVVGTVLCELYTPDTVSRLYAGTPDYGVGLSSFDKGICFRNKTITSLADWKTFLSQNTIYIYLALATPTDTKITDATLVGQLEALGAMRLFIGENNLLVSATGTNLPATLEFSYPTKFAAIGAEWEEGGTKGATIVDVNAIDNTYPVWELMGPAVNPTISVLTTNTTLTYNGTITASQKLVIDMFNKTATLNGTSVIGNVSGDFVYMAPGTNRIAYTAENNDAPDSTIYWQEVVG